MTQRLVILRLFRIVATLLPALIQVYRDRRHYMVLPRLHPVSSRLHQFRAYSLRQKLIKLGPTFIKFGQILSTREDFVPPEYIAELSKLQDRVPPVSFKKIKKLLDAEFGRDAFTIFDSIEPEPIASASLAQVHLAMLNGNKIALKILRPGVENLINADLRLLPLLAVVFQTFTELGENNTLLNVISEFSKTIRREINFDNERNNIEIFRENFRNNCEIIIPQIYPEYCTRQVLAMEYLDGVKISNVDAVVSAGIDRQSVIKTLVTCYLEQVLVYGFFHADPHPGNLLVMANGNLAFLDFGMMVNLPQHLQRLLIRAAIAGARRDLDGLIKSLVELGLLDPEANQQALKKAGRSIIEVFDQKSQNQDSKTGIAKIQQMIRKFHRLAQNFSITLPPYLVYFFKASAEVEGLCLRYDHEFTGISYASPIVKEMARDVLAEEQELITKDIIDKTRELLELPFHLQRIIEQLEEERIRVRMHPKQMRQMETILAFNARRVLFGILAGVISITTAILYVEIHSTLLLVVGFTISSILGTGAITMPARLHLEWLKQEQRDWPIMR